jgi:hypothetical protein
VTRWPTVRSRPSKKKSARRGLVKSKRFPEIAVRVDKKYAGLLSRLLPHNTLGGNMDFRFTRFLFDHLEMILNFAFLLVIVFIHLFLSPYFGNPWRFTACAAIFLAFFYGCVAYAVRRKQRLLREKYLEQAESLIEDEVKVDARLLVDRYSARVDEPWQEMESARRIIELVDYVSDVHTFVLANPVMARLSFSRTTTDARLSEYE